MMNKSRFHTALLLSTAAMVLAACGGSGDVDADSVVLHRGNSAEPLTLDPHKASGTWENNVIGDMFIGLFTDDEHAAPIPGMAESWEVSEDGLVWRFVLREATWSDGVPVTAQDFEYAFQRILNPATLAQYSSLLYPIENAQAVNAGEMEADAVGTMIHTVIRPVRHRDRRERNSIERARPIFSSLKSYLMATEFTKTADSQDEDDDPTPETASFLSSLLGRKEA